MRSILQAAKSEKLFPGTIACVAGGIVRDRAVEFFVGGRGEAARRLGKSQVSHSLRCSLSWLHGSNKQKLPATQATGTTAYRFC